MESVREKVKLRYNTEVLQRGRLAHGLSMAALARKIGVTPPIVSRIESGEIQSPKTIAKLAAELGIRMDELLTG